jgi:hypothetical protein
MNYEQLLKDRIRHADGLELERLRRLYPNNMELIGQVSKELRKRGERPGPENPLFRK